MSKGSPLITVAFIAVTMSPLLLECTTTCQIGNQTDHVEGRCPVYLTSVQSQHSAGSYSECVTVHVWMKADDFCKTPKIEIISPYKEIIRPTMKKRINNKKCNNEKKRREIRVRCGSGVPRLLPQSNISFALWELVHDCVRAKAESVVSVSYSTTSTSCSVSYTVPDPKPDFYLSVNQSSKSITVTVEPDDGVLPGKVYARWSYPTGKGSRPITIDPSESRSALLHIPFLLPCLCVQVYYTHDDARRKVKCPFQNQSLTDVRDVWLTSKVTLFKSKLTWRSECPASNFQISASLCWRRQGEHLCTLVPNSTLEESDGGGTYSTSAVDKHPRMCVQFALQGSHHISCPFQADMSSWEVYMAPGRRSVFLYLTSLIPAKFSAQLCALNGSTCTPVGEVHSVTTDGNATDRRMNVPLYAPSEKPCVQVWRSDPSLRGRRILCPDYTHNRCGLYAVAALLFVVFAVLLGIFIHRLAKKGSAGWICIQKPVLLVCSSDQSAHVSSVCALASILQGELSATVHTALWALGSQSGARAGVSDLGPLPWLYGQWEAVRKAEGKVLIVWSPEGKATYEKWREERANTDKSEREHDYSQAGEGEPNGKRQCKKCKKEKAAGKIDCVQSCDDKDPQREPCTVIAPVFTAAMACLEGALQGCKGQGVAVVYFQGLCHSRDIPKTFRGVPRYCLPQDFRGLIQELGGMRRRTKSSEFVWHCWPRLLTKVLLIWLARQLTLRLKTLLPPMREEKKQEPSVASSLEMMSEKSGLKFPPALNKTRPGTAQEHQPLCGFPWRAMEKL